MHLYIHIPYCVSKCDYCDFFSVPLLKDFSQEKLNDVSVPEEYIDSLVTEIKFRLNEYRIKSLKTVYIGGGTPSLLKPEQIEQVMSAVKETVSFEQNAEITIEMNPETVTEQKLDSCKKAGINRISLGIQSLCDHSLKNVHRHCSSQKAVEALELIKKQWNGLLSVDVIAGLPGTDENQFFHTLQKLVEYNPEHFSMYSLCIEDETPLGKRVQNQIPELSDNADSLWLKGRNFLKNKGYRQYEVSNFCRNDYEAVHNSAYWKQKDYIGCGSGACGTFYSFGDVLKNKSKNGFRYTNTTDIKEYINYWNNFSVEKSVSNKIPCACEYLDLETEEYEFLMMGLRMLSGIEEEIYAERFSSLTEWKGNLGYRLSQNNETWNKFVSKGYIKVYKNIHSKNVYTLNEQGILFLTPLLESLL